MTQSEPDANNSLRWRHSIGYRLSVAFAGIVLVAILAASTLIALMSYRDSVLREQSRAESVANVIASAIADDLLLGNRNGVLQTLTSIRSLPELKFASVLDAKGQPFAEIGNDAFIENETPEMGAVSNFSLAFVPTIWVEGEVRKGGVTTGAVRLLWDLRSLREAAIRTLLLSALFAIGAASLSVMIASRAVRSIIRPLTALSRLMLSLGKEGRYSIRIDDSQKGEIGVLARSFNTMVAQVENRERQLRDYRDNLEKKVELRTRELTLAKDEAENANRAKSDFLATMSHEIRTPMNGMMVMAEMLNNAKLPERERRYAGIIQRSGQNLLAIINDILDISKIEAGKLDLEDIAVRPDEIVAGVLSLFGERAREHGLELSAYISPDTPQSFSGDPARINQIITNLVNNAIKFTERGSVTIHLSTRRAAGASWLMWRIIDTGIGISIEKQAQVFERFTQADQSTTRKYGGTGLGLSISQQLVIAMGGEIGVDSDPGEGSIFWFEIPLRDEVVFEAPKVEAEGHIIVAMAGEARSRDLRRMLADFGLQCVEPGSAGYAGDIAAIVGEPDQIPGVAQLHREAVTIAVTPFGDATNAGEVDAILAWPWQRSEVAQLCSDIVSNALANGRFKRLERRSGDDRRTMLRFNGLRVLAVDDNTVNLEVLDESLVSMGASVWRATSGSEAIAILDQSPFDIVFMDCSMPGMDGFEATREIRQREAATGRARTPVVALTAHIGGGESEQWRDSGMDGYMTKPFTLEAIANALREHCGDVLPATDADGAAQAAVSSDAELWNDTTIDGDSENHEVPVVELISPQTLELLERLSATSGINMASKIFSLYLAHSPTSIEAVERSLAEHDLPETARTAHAFKSMCLSAGARLVADFMQRVEDHAKGGQLDEAADLLPHVKEAFEQTRRAMETLVAGAANKIAS